MATNKKKTKKKKSPKAVPLKIELFINGLIDRLDEKLFPLEGVYSSSVKVNSSPTVSEESFSICSDSNYDQIVDFIKTRREEHPGYLFKDPVFRPRDDVLEGNDGVDDVLWKRPHEISTSPQMFVNSTTLHDVIQGEARDCYFLAPCSVLSMNPTLFEKVIPPGQTLDQNDPSYTGAVQFQLWQFGQWREVVVDDLLPTKNGSRVVYGRSGHNNEFWVSLLEKAYAKLYGSYKAISGGLNSNSLVELTGGIASHYDLSQYTSEQIKEFFNVILKEVHHKSIISCGMEENFNPTTREGFRIVTGLVVNPTYLITAATQIKMKKGKVLDVIRMRNPWGRETPWMADWKQNLNKWSQAEKKSLRKLSHPGEEEDRDWWMPFQEFLKHFSRITVCSLCPEFVDEGKSLKSGYHVSTVMGEWKVDESAGGCGNDIFNYATNPQFILRLSEPVAPLEVTKTGKSLEHNQSPPRDHLTNQSCYIQIGLMQEYRKMEDDINPPPLYEIGLRIYKLKRKRIEKLNRRFLGEPANVVMRSAAHTPQREVRLSGSLSPGYYVIVPSTFYPNDSTTFLLRVFTERETKLKEMF